jgi:hypothetical protein
MAAKRSHVATKWVTYEVLEKDEDGNRTIDTFSRALSAGAGVLPTQAITKMRMVQEIGWPQAKRDLKDDQGRPLIAKKDEHIWLLKCKPSCWRLYFYVWQNGDDRRLNYLHAVCKKQDQEDPDDAAEARRIFGGIRPGGSAITTFCFPAG